MSKLQDKLKQVRLYKDKMGQRQYTLQSLREKVEDQYREETTGRVDLLAELDTREKRLNAVRESAEYVLAQEHVTLPDQEKQQLVEQVVANLFYFGPLDQYLRDEGVTELTLEGPFQAFVRHGFEELKDVPAPFEDIYHLEEGLTRMIAPGGGMLLESEPFVEVGVRIYERPVRISLICPPISPMYSVQVRMHPAQPRTLADFVPNLIPEMAAELLRQIMAAGKGLIITGEVSTAKTTLINALIRDQQDRVVVVERASEMLLPGGFTRLAPIPAKQDVPGEDFGSKIEEAINHHTPRLLVVDEIRGEEGKGFWTAINASDVQQRVIAFRGTNNPARLYSALKITINRGLPNLESAEINRTLLEKVPFVLAMHQPKRDQAPRLQLLAQWVPDGDMLTLEPLVKWNVGSEPERTSAQPRL